MPGLAQKPLNYFETELVSSFGGLRTPQRAEIPRDHKMVWVDWVMLLGWLALLAGGATQRA